MRHRADWEIEEHDEASAEASDETFDRFAFAARVLALLRPSAGTTVAICEGRARVRVAAGRMWGKKGARWAMVSVPPRASRRAIALGVAQLAEHVPPWTLDVLLDEGARDDSMLTS